MTETYGSALERLCGIVGSQTEGYRRLLEATREGLAALRTHDVLRFDEILADQVDTMRELKDLERERAKTMQQVGSPAGDGRLAELNEELKRVVTDVVRANRVSRLVIERNGAVIEARLGLHRRIREIPGAAVGVDETA
jgi:hypothetical protein